MNRTQLSQLAVLAAVAAHGSFRAAAKELKIAPSAVSHAVTRLEESLGIRLLARTTRSVRPTEEGRRLLDSLAPALGEIDAAMAALVDARERPAGNLRITLPRLAADHVIVPRLGSFLQFYPEITVELVTEDRYEDLVAKGYDAGLRLGESLEQDMIAVKASGPFSGAVVATPDYFRAHPMPVHPRDLLRHACIRRRFSSGAIYRWEFEKEGWSLVVDVEGPVILSDDRLMLQACLGGAGIAYLFDQRVAEELRQGHLVRVLEDWCPPFDGFYIYYPSRRQMRPVLRAFVDFYRFGA
ncbi:LysR family transcriptional regulator [Ciceribacter ferrooxidans]|uniref:LysR family transcriptional regulator n=1 Tax=Ciceribacter ferrooxidans TaxID=2509717 RepID=A0A4Q2SVH9_9HYPH|nr:LysR family transcriptional regulator [Ciceribacter ferrooxidans]RYC09822.1 LysR family transcriptional regulator [Ciceribacter ferrooxidans]